MFGQEGGIQRPDRFKPRSGKGTVNLSLDVLLGLSTTAATGSSGGIARAVGGSHLLTCLGLSCLPWRSCIPIRNTPQQMPIYGRGQFFPGRTTPHRARLFLSALRARPSVAYVTLGFSTHGVLRKQIDHPSYLSGEDHDQQRG